MDASLARSIKRSPTSPRCSDTDNTPRCTAHVSPLYEGSHNVPAAVLSARPTVRVRWLADGDVRNGVSEVPIKQSWGFEYADQVEIENRRRRSCAGCCSFTSTPGELGVLL